MGLERWGMVTPGLFMDLVPPVMPGQKSILYPCPKSRGRLCVRGHTMAAAFFVRSHGLQTGPLGMWLAVVNGIEDVFRWQCASRYRAESNCICNELVQPYTPPSARYRLSLTLAPASTCRFPCCLLLSLRILRHSAQLQCSRHSVSTWNMRWRTCNGPASRPGTARTWKRASQRWPAPRRRRGPSAGLRIASWRSTRRSLRNTSWATSGTSCTFRRRTDRNCRSRLPYRAAIVATKRFRSGVSKASPIKRFSAALERFKSKSGCGYFIRIISELRRRLQAARLVGGVVSLCVTCEPVRAPG